MCCFAQQINCFLVMSQGCKGQGGKEILILKNNTVIALHAWNRKKFLTEKWEFRSSSQSSRAQIPAPSSPVPVFDNDGQRAAMF